MAYVCTDEMFIDMYRNDSHEIEANAFASEFLMPEKQFRDFVSGRQPKWEVIEEAATKFKVSLTAACIRYVEVGWYPCVLFTSRDGILCWYRSSYDMQSLRHIAVGDPVKEWSCAGEYFQEGKKEKTEGYVFYDAWFMDKADEKDKMVQETPFYIDSLNTVLSLVWFD